MRVLHVSDCYLPRLGGIETQVHHLAQRQQAAGHAVEVLTATPRARHDRTAFEVIDGVGVHRAVVDLPFELPVHPRAGAQVGRLLSQARRAARPYDVAHVHTGVISQFAYAAIPALLAAAMPVVVTVHSMWGPAAVMLRPLDRLVGWSRRPIVISAVSWVAAEPLRRAGAQVRVIPNGIDVNLWRLDPLPRNDSELVVASVMRLAPRKRGIALLRALHTVRQNLAGEVRLRALIVGEGPDRRRLERYLDGPGAAVAMRDWVELPGRWDAAAIRELYRRADMFVSAAELESFGIAALEARAAGIPVVARDSTGVGEFVRHDVHGLLVPDDAQLAAAVLALARDPARRHRLAEAARAEPPPTTWDAVLERCEAAYRDAITLRTPR
ncbi:MAG: glycosyltransferase family 4 protein [Kineosporiaceae bacterium]|nr:glycosyltransferase family 4 protein [Kineosporiaceae bacterium]